MIGPENLGYACMNHEMSSRPKKHRITTNRTMIKETFNKKGINYAADLAYQNVQDLYKILLWNEENNFKFFRLSSNIFPWHSEYRWEDLPLLEHIERWLTTCGDFAKEHGHRLTSHPGPFNKLTSDNDRIINNTIRDLEAHGWLFDRLGLPRTPFAKINIHVGAAYGNKEKACDNFCRNFEKLSDSVKTRLTVENDDKASLYSTQELYDLIYKRIGIPIVHDVHHHGFCTGGLSQEDAMRLAASTWGDVRPVIHYSQSRAFEHNNPKIKPQAHSDSYWEPVETFGLDVDVMCEAKHKEQAVYALRNLMFD